LKRVLDENIFDIDPVDGTSTLNDLIVAPLTQGQSGAAGTVSFPGILFEQGMNINVGGLNADIDIRVSNARIENIDTLGAPLGMLEPIHDERNTLNNTATIGVGRPLRASVTVMFAVNDGGDLQLRNEVELTLDVHAATLAVITLLRIVEDRFLQFPLRDVMELDCWLASFVTPTLDGRGVRMADIAPSAALEDLAMSIAQMRLRVKCIECSSPGIQEFADLVSSPEAVEDSTRVANDIVDYAAGFLNGRFLQVQIDRAIVEATQKCPHSPEYNPNAPAKAYEAFDLPEREDGIAGFLIAMAVITGVLIAFSFIAALVLKKIVQRAHRRWLLSLAPEDFLVVAKEQEGQDDVDAEINRTTKSMFTSEVIPLYARWLMPVVIVGNILFFLSGHLSLGATISIYARFAEEELKVSSFFEFSMARSTVDLWNAGAKELAALIFLLSGVWPYTKQLITLALWMLPPTYVSVQRRGKIFEWLDVLSKWSMVDIFVLLVSIAAFKISIMSPQVAFLPESFYVIDLLVVPMWGLYANMIAQVISQVSSHFIIHLHRKILDEGKKAMGKQHRVTTGLENNKEEVEKGDSSEDEDENWEMHVTDRSRDQLCKYWFFLPHRNDGRRVYVREFCNKVVLLLIVLLVVLILIASTRTAFHVEVLGILGVAVESGQRFGQAVTDHSLFSMVQLIIDNIKYLDTVGHLFGLGMLAILLVATVLLVPILQAGTLLLQWFLPMTKVQRNRMAVQMEILQAWQYVEVYVISIIVATWQLGGVSEFMINNYCSALDDTFASLVYYGVLREEDAQCLRVEAQMETSCYLFFVAAIILSFVTTFVSKADKQYMTANEQPIIISAPTYEESDEDEAPESCDVGDFKKDDEASNGFVEIDSIRPVGVQFTDMFWFVLVKERPRPAILQDDDLSDNLSNAPSMEMA